MRVYGLEVQVPALHDVRGSATYTRRPASTLQTYNTATLLPPATLSAATTHRVQTGENLTRIVREFLSSSGERPTNAAIYAGVGIVARDNGLANPDLIHPGLTLDLSGLTRRGDGPTAMRNTSALPAITPPLPGPISSAPVSRRSLADIRPLAAPAITNLPVPLETAPSEPPAGPEAKHRPADRLLERAGGEPAGEPVRISRSTAAALAAPQNLLVAEAPHVHAGAAGGPGPEMPDGVIALQRVLNRTSNALQALRNLMDGGDVTATGDNSAGPWASLVRGKARLSSEFGTRKDPFTGRMAFHDGVDLAVKRGTDITAVRDGVVVHSGWKDGYGNTVILRHEGGIETIYAHASKTHVQPGETVAAGMHIADVGSSGRSTGPHIHFEVREHGRAVNPMPYLE